MAEKTSRGKTAMAAKHSMTIMVSDGGTPSGSEEIMIDVCLTIELGLNNKGNNRVALSRRTTISHYLTGKW